ncbi:uncharacterized protein K02A2.6-like [Armigeres subalbatus]|uniref:uncharacterized protein K02A2.6-like n=1 Tax=Armigeres subalbatus TaxID=124917 RepID=UPI002ED437C0
MMRILGHMKNVIVYIDDILVSATSLEELHITVAQVQQILKNNNLTLNMGKCELDKSRIKFLGHELDESGFHVDEEKIKHLQQFRQPATVSELHAQGVIFILNRSREDSKRALTRADGWALRLSPYSYDIEYVRGRDNIADPSSRLYVGIDEPFEEDTSPWEIASLEVNTAGFLTEEEIRTSTNKDTTLQEVIQALEYNNWPKKLQNYKSVANYLTTKDGILVKQGCVVIPEDLRSKTLEVAHLGHPMTDKLKSILRKRVWWPGISKDAENWVKSCEVCATTGRPEKPTPMERVFAPKEVWETIAMDFNGPYSKFGGIYILLIRGLPFKIFNRSRGEVNKLRMHAENNR